VQVPLQIRAAYLKSLQGLTLHTETSALFFRGDFHKWTLRWILLRTKTR